MSRIHPFFRPTETTPKRTRALAHVPLPRMKVSCGLHLYVVLPTDGQRLTLP